MSLIEAQPEVRTAPDAAPVDAPAVAAPPAAPPPKQQSRTLKTLILASGEFLSTLVNLASFAVLARVLTVEDYATYRQTTLAFFFAVPLLTLGLPQALYYFLPGEQKRPRAILLENMLLLTLMAAVFTVFLLAGGGKLLAMRFSNPGLERTLLLYAPYPLLILPAMGLAACLMARDRSRQVAVYNVASRLVTGVLIIGAALLWRNASGPILANVAAAAVVLVPALWLMFRATRGGQSSLPTPAGAWEQTKFAVPLGLATMLGAVSISLDKVIVASMCSLEDFAIYSNGAMEIPLIGVVTGSITAVLLPDIRRLRLAGKNAEAMNLWKNGMQKSALAILPVMCFFFCMGSELVEVMFSSKYAASVMPFRLYLLLLPIRALAFGAMLMVAGKSKLILFRAALELGLNFALSLVLVHYFGYIGTAIAGITTVYCWTGPYNMITICRLYGVSLKSLLPIRSMLITLMIALFACLGCVPVLLYGDLGSLSKLVLALPLYLAICVPLMIKFKVLRWSPVWLKLPHGLRSRAER